MIVSAQAIVQLQALRDLEAKQNEGRGVQCVKAIIRALDDGNPYHAVQIANNEGDKIRNYPEIEELLHQLLDWL